MPRRKSYRSAEIKAGITIIVSGFILALFMVAISGARLFDEMAYYRVHLAYIGGLELGSEVRLGGNLIGKISDIRILYGDSVGNMMTIEVPPDTKIKDNTVAFLSFVSLTSAHHLELEPSAEPAPLLRPGDIIPSKEKPSMDDVITKMNVMGDTLLAMSARIGRIVDEENIARIDSIINGVNYMVSAGGEELVAVLKSGRELTESLDTLVTVLNNAVASGSGKFDKILDETQYAVTQARVTLADIDTTVVDVNTFFKQNSNDLIKLLENLSVISENIKVLSATIKDNPYLLIRSVPREERKLKNE